MRGAELPITGTTRRRADGLIETTVRGRATEAMAREWIESYRRLGGAKVWLFFAEETTSYEPRAAATVGEGFAELHRTMGLRHVVAAIASPLVRMGARTVAMLSKVDIRVASDATEAELIAKTLR